MKKFITKTLILIFPFFICTVIYVVFDPFKVIRTYTNYYQYDEVGRVGINRDWVSTNTFIDNSQTINYDSFIFGNSRSIFYEINDWKKYIEPHSNCYHFDASGEALYGIYKKILFLDRNDTTIKNVIIIFDYDTLSKIIPNQGHLSIISPQLEDNNNLIDFHLTFIKTFYNLKFMAAFIDYKISGKIKEYMKTENLLDDRPLHYDVITNEITYPNFEELIENGLYFTDSRMKVFFERGTHEEVSPVVIKQKQINMLQEIADIFQRYHTNYKIIISPLYDQKKLNPQDLEALRSIFGKDTVYDFSGIN
ncbi:MAG: hypothetical protein LBC53_06910, partial [Spirochaetaceae bacterium]|nr:hypothetical protein [Spirochaetaceae bacterium]